MDISGLAALRPFSNVLAHVSARWNPVRRRKRAPLEAARADFHKGTRRALAAAVLIAATSTATSALAQGTEEERRACTPDVMRLCREFIPSVKAITQCLIDKKAELNPDCRQVMAPTKPEPVRHAATPAKKRVATPRVTKPHGASEPVATANKPPAARPAKPRTAARPPTAAKPQTAAAEPGGIARPPMDIAPGAGKPAAASKKSARPKPAANKPAEARNAATANPPKATAAP